MIGLKSCQTAGAIAGTARWSIESGAETNKRRDMNNGAVEHVDHERMVERNLRIRKRVDVCGRCNVVFNHTV
jgi:hypothetical protein